MAAGVSIEDIRRVVLELSGLVGVLGLFSEVSVWLLTVHGWLALVLGLDRRMYGI